MLRKAALWLTASLHRGEEPSGEPKTCDLRQSTVVRQGRGVGELDALKPGQRVLFNLTWATLIGPGRLLEIWLDEESRRLATTQQTRRHHDHLRERGLPGWVESVDDATEVITITFFDTFDPALFEDLKLVHETTIGWPLVKEPKDPLAPKGTIAVARESLLLYDPINDRHGGNLLKTEKLPSLGPEPTGLDRKIVPKVLSTSSKSPHSPSPVPVSDRFRCGGRDVREVCEHGKWFAQVRQQAVRRGERVVGFLVGGEPVVLVDRAARHGRSSTAPVVKTTESWRSIATQVSEENARISATEMQRILALFSPRDTPEFSGVAEC